jgi:hypothetical protein
MTVMRLEFTEPVSVGSGGLDAVLAVEVTADLITFDGDHIAFWHGADQLGRIPVSTLARVGVQQPNDVGESRRRSMATRRTWQPNEPSPTNGYADEVEVDGLPEYRA